MRRRISRQVFELGVIAALIGLLAPSSAPAQVDVAFKGVATQAVAPEYPLEARRRRLQGSGILEAAVDFKTGRVTSVRMVESTGHKILDEAALAAFRQWRFKPRLVRTFRTPINYTMVNRP